MKRVWGDPSQLDGHLDDIAARCGLGEGDLASSSSELRPLVNSLGLRPEHVNPALVGPATLIRNFK